jgi:predicted transcriptional regulator
LEDKEEILALHEDGCIRYYITGSWTDSQDRRATKTRRKIYNLISLNPGLHLSKIAEILDMRISLAEYHLLQMEKSNVITAIRDDSGYFKRFYIKDSDIGIKEKKILSLLRQELLLKIVLFLYKNPNAKHKEISECLKIVPSTLSYHLGRLEENDIVDVTPYGKEKGYLLKNEKEIIWVVRKYKLELLLERFKDMWEDLGRS